MEEVKVKIRSWLGCGISLIGREIGGGFRPEVGLGLYCASYTVEYLFVTIFYLPLFPIGCYRIKEQPHQDGFSTYIKYSIAGEEKPLAKEIIWLIVSRWLYVIALVGFIVWV